MISITGQTSTPEQAPSHFGGTWSKMLVRKHCPGAQLVVAGEIGQR